LVFGAVIETIIISRTRGIISFILKMAVNPVNTHSIENINAHPPVIVFSGSIKLTSFSVSPGIPIQRKIAQNM
jgi:hypothetical protein